MNVFNSEDIILITGASSGIGRQVCQDLNKSGAFVIAVARDIQKLESLNREIEFPENFAIEQKDLSKEPEKLEIWIKDISKKLFKLKYFGSSKVNFIRTSIPQNVTSDSHQRMSMA